MSLVVDLNRAGGAAKSRRSAGGAAESRRSAGGAAACAPESAKRHVLHDVSLTCLQRALYVGGEPPWAIRVRLELEGIATVHAPTWAIARDVLANERPALLLAEPDVAGIDMVGILLGLLGGEGQRVGVLHDVSTVPMLVVPAVAREPGVVLHADRPADEIPWAELPDVAVALARREAAGP